MSFASVSLPSPVFLIAVVVARRRRHFGISREESDNVITIHHNVYMYVSIQNVYYEIIVTSAYHRRAQSIL